MCSSSFRGIAAGIGLILLLVGANISVGNVLILLQEDCSGTAKEGPVRIQYICLVPIYVFPEIKLLFPKQNYNVLCPRPYTHISVRDLYISRIGLPILLQGNMWTNPGNI
jgi:hypothetical protein